MIFLIPIAVLTLTTAFGVLFIRTAMGPRVHIAMVRITSGIIAFCTSIGYALVGTEAGVMWPKWVMWGIGLLMASAIQALIYSIVIQYGFPKWSRLRIGAETTASGNDKLNIRVMRQYRRRLFWQRLRPRWAWFSRSARRSSQFEQAYEKAYMREMSR